VVDRQMKERDAET